MSKSCHRFTLSAIALFSSTMFASAVSSDDIYVTNNSCEEVEIVVNYKERSSERWTTSGKHYLLPGETDQLKTIPDGPPIDAKGNIIYFWAQLNQSKSDGWSGTSDDPRDKIVTFMGKEYYLDFHKNRGADIDLTLGTRFDDYRCPNEVYQYRWMRIIPSGVYETLCREQKKIRGIPLLCDSSAQWQQLQAG